MNKTLLISSLLPVILLALAFSGLNAGKESQWPRSRDRQSQDLLYDSLGTQPFAGGLPLEVTFTAGPAHNHPLMALWIEDLDSNYVQTLFVAESIGKGVFRHGDPSSGRWMPGPVRRPAALPYWGHQRGVQASDGYYIPSQDDPMPDAITGATPQSHFVLKTQLPDELSQFRILFEINQSWDWNEHWTNDKFPGDEHYMSSSQPALVYEAFVDLEKDQSDHELKVIGHSHWSGEDGRLFSDLSTITTALDITRSIRVRVGAAE